MVILTGPSYAMVALYVEMLVHFFLQTDLPLALVAFSDFPVVLFHFPSLSSLMKRSEAIPHFTAGLQQQSRIVFERLAGMVFLGRGEQVIKGRKKDMRPYNEEADAV